MSTEELITVEVAYALPKKQRILSIEVARGTTALDAVQQSGIASEFEDLELDNAPLGIFGKRVPPDQALQPGDRVEIYRPLIADPKAARKERAAKARQRRAGT